jgi:hypothetical protein
MAANHLEYFVSEKDCLLDLLATIEYWILEMQRTNIF